MKLFGVGTSWNQYLFEWRHAAQLHGWDYKIVGLGQPWQGFNKRMEWMRDELLKLPSDEVVFICDTYDALVQRGPEDLREIYDKYFTKSIVVGAEPGCLSTANCYSEAPAICEPDIYQRMYPNAGAMVGPASALLKFYQYGLDNKMKDDQYAFGRFWAENCDMIELDRDSRIVYNVLVTMPTEEVPGNKLAHPKTGIVPVLIHMPGQPFDFGVRSRKARRVILPFNKPMPALGSITEFSDQLNRVVFQCEEMYYIWIPCVVVVGLILLFLIGALAYKKYKR